MATKSLLKLRSRSLALRFFTICLIQTIVMVYFVTQFTESQKPQLPFPQAGLQSETGQIAIDQALDDIWAGKSRADGTQLASLVPNWEPSNSSQSEHLAQLRRQGQIAQMIGDFQIGFSKSEVTQLTQVIDAESRRYDHDPRLLIAVILTESSLRKGDISYQGAHGLMQIKPAVALELAERKGIRSEDRRSLFDPEYNIKLGSLYLFELLMKYGDIRKALIAYNLGETEMRSRLLTNRQLPSQYVHKVLARYQELLEKYPDA